MALLIYSIILFCIALPLANFARFTIGLSISFSLLDILVAIGALVYLGRQLFLRKSPESLQAKSFILLIGVFVVSLGFNIQHYTPIENVTASLYIVRFVLFGTLFFLFKDAPREVSKKLSVIFFTGGLLLLIGGYVQYFLYPNLRNLSYFGWDVHFYRMFGTFFDPNFFGLFLVCLFLFICTKLFHIDIQKQKVLFTVLFVAGAAVFFAIILSYSRTALFALLCGLVVVFWSKSVRKWFWTIFFALLLTAIIAFVALGRKAEGNDLLRLTSSGARLGSVHNALVIFTDSPIIGIGFNAYRYAQYRHHFMKGSAIQEDHGASGVDSSLLLVLATCGIAGISAYLFYLWSHIKILAKRKDSIGRATLIAIFVGSFFVNGLFYPALLVWLWAILGITENVSP